MRCLPRVLPFALFAVLALCTSAVDADLRIEVEHAVRSTQLKSATLAVSVRNTATNVELVSIGAEEPMIPASNMKLLTTGASLHLLGADFAFRTMLLRVPDPASKGDRLVILGDGDPAFADPELLELMDHPPAPEHTSGASTIATGIDAEAFLKYWINPIREAGLRSVTEVVVDDRIFDREFVHPTWPVDQLNRRYCAQVSGFNFHLNTLHFYPRPPAGGGARPDISDFRPRVTWLDIANSGTVRTEPDDANTAWIARVPESNRMRFHGNVKFAYRVPVPVTVHDTPSFFARLFADRLRIAGIRVGTHRVAGMDDPRFAGEGEVIGPVVFSSMSTVLTRCNRDSNNLYAEALLKRSGAAMTQQPGSWTNGAAVMRHAIHERLRSPSLAKSVVIADGSGLSRDNRVAAGTLTAWLNTFHADSALGPTFIESLAEPGGEGTLRNRFRNADLSRARVQAKSGYISGVSCLSGFVTAPDGRRRSFSILVNELPDQATVAQARRLQERIVELIAADMARATVQMGSD